MNGRKIKKEIISLVGQIDLDSVLIGLCEYPDKQLVSPLFSALCRTEENIRWHAVSAFGQVVARIAEVDIEEARIVMRRLIWSLNDESGGIGWGAPEAMAEIIYHNDQLAEEYLHMLISYCRKDGPELYQDGNFLELPQLQRGLLWGVGRVAARRGDVLREKGVVYDLLDYCQSDDATVCAMAIWALGQLRAEEGLEPAHNLLADVREIRFYYEGQLTTKTVADFASVVLSRLGNS